MIVGLRHGVVRNPERVVYARLPGFHLSHEGRAAVEVLARALAAAPVAAVYASPLERAQETAEILAATHGLEVRTDDRLLEWSFWTRWQGLPWDRIRERDPELLEEYARDPSLVYPQDPLASAGERVLAWASDADRALPDGDGAGLVVGVTHEAPLIAAMLAGRGRGVRDYHAFNLPHLGAVRLLPGPPETVDLVEWAASC